jgi:diguanylate cyclase (GGDEF)-like protein/PAS domain S-box-containing protein
MLTTILTIALALTAALALLALRRGQVAASQAQRDEQIAGQILDLTHDGYLLLDREHHIQDANGKACGLLGQSREALVKRSIFAFIDRNSLPGLLDGTGAAGEWDQEFNLALPGGPTFPCRARYTTLTGEQGRPDGAILLLRDLTGKEQHEAYLRRIAAVFEHTAEGVMILDTDGRISLLNPAFTTITGFRAEEVQGKTPQFLRYGQIWAEVLATGHWQGEIVNHRKNGESYPEWLTISAVHAPDGMVQNYIGLFSDVTHMKKSELELKHMAHYDALTDLPNRTLFSIQLNMALERAARRDNKLAVFGLDLDGFKTVNDSLGHPAGDLLLQKIASRLRLTLRGEDVVARMGGDEFAMIIENPPSAIHIGHLAEKIIAAVSKPLELFGSSATVSASIGIAIFPQDGEDATTLLKAADTAMYASKQAGKCTYRYHDDEMARAANQRLVIEQGLRVALERNELALIYQPQVDIRTGEVLGVEALLRWQHPERGTLAPAEFIPVAEETGLMPPLGEWVLREACRQAQAWVKEQTFLGTLSVNVASQQIERGSIFATVKRVLDETGFNPKRLTLEITETVLLRNTKQAMAELGQLRTLGVSIVIDDFGIGYSSLAYLKYLSAQGIKIDQRFVLGLPADKNDAAITRAIIAMAHSLGFDLIAEGVETEAQQSFLAAEGCQRVQGTLYSGPIPGAEFPAWLREHRPHFATLPMASAGSNQGRRGSDQEPERGGETGTDGVLTHPRWWQ